MSRKARAYITFIIVSGFGSVLYGISQWESQDPLRYLCYLLIGGFASTLKVTLPGITGTMSVSFLFILIGVVELSLSETLFIGILSTVVQVFWRARLRPRAIQVAFNISQMALAIFVCHASYHMLQLPQAGSSPLLLALSATVYFIMNTIPIAAVISLTENRSLAQIWKECYFWSFPYYLVGASIAWALSIGNAYFGWPATLLILPIIYFIYRSYRLYLGRLEAEKDHVEKMAALHLRTIEALALAIEAKDHTTHDHLRRVQVYAMEIGKHLKLSPAELEALRAAALLHDIGKLAVPEHILSKPGKLTPEEFEKIKIHPVVGAEILERVQFPYPVVPIVRAHHERWDGTGYPDGLAGEAIPIGARILSVVDCLDALASDRQYRRALPLDQAMETVASLAGSNYDPQVIAVLSERYRELERMAHDQQVTKQPLSTDLKVERGEAPAAGFESATARPADVERQPEFLFSIAAARQEAQMLFELTQDLGNSLSLDETLSVLAVRLKRLIPYDAIAIYIVRERRLVPEFVSGENFRLFSSLEIPLGEGLSGWVAENRKPIVNGNPSVEPGYLNDPSRYSTLSSALAVPLEGISGVVGVLSLYKGEREAFDADHLRITLAIASKLGISIENALRYRQAESSATTDYLTDLPNARSLFLHLDGELARCKRMGLPLAVLVCDLDGFKGVNDSYGHLEGNRVLKLVARGLQEACREYDYVARMGGDEFVVVLPGLKAESLQKKSDHLRAIAEAAGRQLFGSDLLSMSIGAALYPDDGTDAEQLLAEADRRMYKVKESHKTPLRVRNMPSLRPSPSTLPIQ
jgi:diguanylate cyclase (GGDEF)-like protein/putative nucleotidyltransferase with HDIG domain